MKRMLLALALFGLTTSAIAQPASPGFPAGKWWERPAVIDRLKLSTDQRGKLDEVFGANADQLIDLRADVERLSISLRAEMDRQRVDRAVVQKTTARLNDARAKLFEREILMFVDMRQVLTEEQWATFRNVLDKQREQKMQRGGDRRPGQGRPPGQGGGGRPPGGRP